ncbi:MAG: Wzz/FepE/Etk N-terminal domain-containing protein [Egibacteraceae bacterium]
MSAGQILSILWCRRLTVLIGFVLVMGTAAAVTLSLPKVYSTTAYMIVKQVRSPTSSFEATQVNQVLTRTYGELLQTRRIAERVRPALPFRMTVDELLASVSVNIVSDSQLLSVTAEGSTPLRAQQLANTYTGVFVGEARALDISSGGAQVAIAQRAARVTRPSRPRPVLYLAIAFVLASLLAAGLGLLRHRLDQRLQIDAGTTEVLGVPVIGYAPKTKARLGEAGTWQAQDAFRLLIANLAFVNGGERPRSITVVSSAPQEGKSTSSFGIARTAAEIGISVMLVDADLRRPSISAIAQYLDLDIAGRGGLADYLASGGRTSIDDMSVHVPGTSLMLVPTTPAPTAPALLASAGLRRFNEEALRTVDLVIYDTPPLTLGPDASLVAAQSDGVVFVLDARRTRRNVAMRGLEQLRRTDAKILGVLINRADELSDAGDYYAESGAGDGPITSPASVGPSANPVNGDVAVKQALGKKP